MPRGRNPHALSALSYGMVLLYVALCNHSRLGRISKLDRKPKARHFHRHRYHRHVVAGMVRLPPHEQSDQELNQLEI